MTKFNHFEQKSSIESPILLPESFPAQGASLYEQTDKDITVLHFHKCLEIGYCYEGSGIFVIADRLYPFQKGDASLIHAGQIHLAQSTKGTISKWRFLSLDAIHLTSYLGVDEKKIVEQWQISNRSKILNMSTQSKAITLICEIIEEFVGKSETYQSMIRLKIGALVFQTIRDEKLNIDTKSGFDEKIFNRILPAIQMILRNYANPIQIDYLASLCHLSPAQFRRLFLSTMGVPPQSYLMSVRLNHADQLLKTSSLKIVDIAYQVGFATLSSFNRAFLKTYHRIPKHSRNR
jgi:AraC-like DNA-binding protein